MKESGIATERGSALREQRLGSIDLLRVICAVFVVFEHFCESGIHNAFGFAQASSFPAYVLLRLLYAVARVAVPVFFIISGYLSAESKDRRLGKVITLFAMAYFFSVLPSIASVLLQQARSEAADFGALLKTLVHGLLVKNYYLYLFTALYCLSPYLNLAIGRLGKKQYLRLLVIAFILFSVWSTVINSLIKLTDHEEWTGVFFIGRDGTSMGFNAVNFMMLYLAGAYLRRFPPENAKRSRAVAAVVLVISTAIMTVGKVWFPRIAKTFYYYDSVFVECSALSLFVIVSGLRVPAGRALSFMGRKTFGTYLIHGFASQCIERFVSIEKTVGRGLGGTVLGIAIFVLGVFILSLAITAFFTAVFVPLNRRWKKTRLYNLPFYRE